MFHFAEKYFILKCVFQPYTSTQIMKKLLSLSYFFLLCFCAVAQNKLPRIDTLVSGRKTSIRGLSVVNNNIVWVSGSNGTVGKSTNGGKDWKWYQVKAFEKA